MTAFRYCTLLFLLAAEDLRSFRSGIRRSCLPCSISAAARGASNLCDDVAAIRRAVRPLGCESCGRSATLADKLQLIWPGLALISCWTDAAAGQFLPQLRELFPAIEIQPKGLLATEAFVSFPLVEAAAQRWRCGRIFSSLRRPREAASNWHTSSTAVGAIGFW